MRSKEKPAADSRVQFSLRLPADLHARLVERAGLVPLNSFIVQSLETSLKADEVLKTVEEVLQQSEQSRQSVVNMVETLVGNSTKAINEMTAQVRSLSETLAEETKSSTVILKAFLEETRKQVPPETYEAIQKAARDVLEKEPLTDSAKMAIRATL